MASSTEEVAVFINTNLGTHVAIAVPPDITVGNSKRKLKQTHFSCFPNIGEIKVNGLMVKRKSSFYHLPDRVPIRHAFQGLQGSWFLHAEVRPLIELHEPHLSQNVDAKVREINLNGMNCTDSLIASTEKNDVTSNGKKGRIESPHGKAPLSQVVTRTVPQSNTKRKEGKIGSNLIGCINGIEKGCPVTQRKDKADDNCLGALPQLTVKTPPRTLHLSSRTYSRHGTSKTKPGKPEVGKCLVKATKNLRVSACKKSSTITLSIMKKRKLSHCSTESVAKFLVFEIGDQGD